MSQASGKTRTGGSGVLLWVLIVASCVAVVLATVAIGVEQVLLNTDRWVAAVGPLASNPNVQSSLAEAASTQVMTALDAQIQSLPGPLQRLAIPAEPNLNGFVHDQALNVAQSPQFAALWIELNRAGHAALVQLLRGQVSPGGALAVSNGDLQLNLLALMPPLAQRMQQVPDNLLPMAPTADFGYVSLAPAGALGTAQQFTQLLDRSTWLLVLAAVVLVLLTLAASGDRRLTAMWLGVGVGIGMLLIGLGLITAQGAMASSLADRPISGALQAAVSAAVMSLAVLILIVFIAAGAVALVAFISGRTRPAAGVQ